MKPLKLRVQINEREFSDLLYQYLLENKPSALLTEVSKALHASATALDANDRALDAEWRALMGRRIDKVAAEAHRDEADFYRTMGD